MPSRPARASAPLLVTLLIAAAIAGCGGSSSSSGNGVADKTPAEILAATKTASDAATSVHVSGSIVSEKSPITLDVSLLAGKGGRGKISENGLPFELIQAGGSVYIKGTAAFYKRIGGTAAAQLLQGKWLKAPSSDANFASLSQLTDLRQLVDQTLTSHGSLRKPHGHQQRRHAVHRHDRQALSDRDLQGRRGRGQDHLRSLERHGHAGRAGECDRRRAVAVRRQIAPEHSSRAILLAQEGSAPRRTRACRGM
jgi:hypothetical protein